jgi:phosphoenolpyruvate carboxykinase (ATP)
MKRIESFGSKVFIVNSGWTGGPYGVGNRFDIPVTRSVIKAIQDGSIHESSTEMLDIMNVEIPVNLDGVDSKLLNPSATWGSKSDYDSEAKQLAEKFRNNIEKFNLSSEVVAAGPKV